MTEERRDAGAQGAQGGTGSARDERRGAGDEQDQARAYRQQLKRLHAVDLGYEMALSLVSFGSQKMGLTDQTAELRDLGDAQLSIELLRALLDVLEKQGAAAPGGELRDTLAQLQLAYAQAVQLATTEAAAGTGEQPGGPGPAAAEPEQGQEAGPESQEAGPEVRESGTDPQPGPEPDAGEDEVPAG